MLSIRFFLLNASTLVFCCIVAANSVQAQIVPDTTLPQNSRVVPGCTVCTIEDGTIKGDNLFHSFEQFSVPTGGEAIFNNAAHIQNIFSRVTGQSISNIDGLIRTNGTANLFLLNPNGIIFGSNASLDLKGSFIATTASSILFDYNRQFSAIDPQETLPLKINVPIGLQFGKNPGAIRNRSTVLGTFGPIGLKVQPNQTLALVGGNVLIEGGFLTAPAGKIELGSVAGGSFVSLSRILSDWALGYEKVSSFQDIKLSQEELPLVNANSDIFGYFISGNVRVQGRRVELADGSSIASFNLSRSPGGSILINAERLVLKDGSRITTGARGLGNAGNLTVNADTIEIDGISQSNSSGLFSQTFASGNAGVLTIKTRQMIVRNGGQIGASTFNIGRGGNLNIEASDFIVVSGKSANGQIFSGLFAQSTQDETTGNAGILKIDTQRLIIRDGARVSVGVVDGSTGQGGELNINASDFVEVAGTGLTNEGREVPSTLLAESQGSGDAGNLTIATNRLIVRDGAAVSVSSSSPEAQAGNLTIKADTVDLNRGNLTAETNLSRGNEAGANINLQGLNLLRLENGSLISATASGDANGGNINIDTKYLIALPSKGFGGNDIIANAFRGNGGNINITAQRIFGIESRLSKTQFNDITASSEFGTNGVIEINTPEFEPTREELPANLVDVSRLIEQNLCQAGQGSQFTVTGRGGLPNSPNEAFSSNEMWEDWRIAESSQQPVTSQPTLSQHKTIVEAQGWVVNSQGKVVLTAEPIATLPRTPILTQSGCRWFDRSENYTL